MGVKGRSIEVAFRDAQLLRDLNENPAGITVNGRFERTVT
jgi:hypothetical protein